MHEALVGPGGERMCAVGRDCGFGRHAGVSDRVRSGHRVEAEAFGNAIGPADFLENLHATAAADNGKFRHGGNVARAPRFPVPSGTMRTRCVSWTACGKSRAASLEAVHDVGRNRMPRGPRMVSLMEPGTAAP